MSSPAKLLWRRFLSLPGSDQRLLLEAWWRLLAAALRLRLAPRRSVARAVRETAPSQGRREDCELAMSVARAVGRAAAHHLAPMTCLPRALALQRMLAHRGILSALRIGVRKDLGGGSGIAAHAWIEVAGRALGEPEAIEERFRPLLPALPIPEPRDGPG